MHRLAGLFLFFALAANAQVIRDAGLVSANEGWLLSDRLLLTADAGASWRDVAPAVRPDAAFFLDGQTGWMVKPGVEVAFTRDGGTTWTWQRLEVEAERYAGNAWLHFADHDHGWLLLQFSSSSNYSRGALYATGDGGNSWQRLADAPAAGRLRFTSATEGTITGGRNGEESFVTRDGGRTWQVSAAGREQPRGPAVVSRHGLRGAVSQESFRGDDGWLVVQQGVCTGFKTGCTLSSRLLRTSDGGVTVHDITPPRPAIAADSLPAVVFSTRRGFDKCAAPSVAQLQDWWQNSPYRDLNVYLGGINRGCAQPNLTADWIQQVSKMGWSLIPTWVGPQAPCDATFSGNARISGDRTAAALQGTAEADAAAAALTALGLPHTIVYYDLEYYSASRNDTTCVPAVQAFLTAWTQELHKLAVVAGSYGSPINMAADWLSIPLDVIWMGRWDFRATVWGDPSLSDQYWRNHQRIHQYYNTDKTGGETWGSTTFFIDANIEDAPLATATANPNVTPETGWWWNPVQSGLGFFLEKQADGNLFFTGLLYDASGRATWVLSNGPMKSSSYSGPLHTYGNGQTLTGAYRPAQITNTPGTLALQFFDATHASLTWPGGAIPIQRLGFTPTGLPASPGSVQNGWWWNPEESGRGFALEIQNGILFLAGLMYDDAGNPIWYLAHSILSDPMHYQGAWAQYGNGQTLTGPLKPNVVVNANVGSLQMSFSDATHGILTLPDGRQIAITRLYF